MCCQWRFHGVILEGYLLTTNVFLTQDFASHILPRFCRQPNFVSLIPALLGFRSSTLSQRVSASSYFPEVKSKSPLESKSIMFSTSFSLPFFFQKFIPTLAIPSI